MRKNLKKLGILVVLAAVTVTGCGKREASVPRALEQETGTALATLGDEPIYLEEALFYTRMLQEQWEATRTGRWLRRVFAMLWTSWVCPMW